MAPVVFGALACYETLGGLVLNLSVEYQGHDFGVEDGLDVGGRSKAAPVEFYRRNEEHLMERGAHKAHTSHGNTLITGFSTCLRLVVLMCVPTV